MVTLVEPQSGQAIPLSQRDATKNCSAVASSGNFLNNPFNDNPLR